MFYSSKKLYSTKTSFPRKKGIFLIFKLKKSIIKGFLV